MDMQYIFLCKSWKNVKKWEIFKGPGVIVKIFDISNSSILSWEDSKRKSKLFCNGRNENLQLLIAKGFHVLEPFLEEKTFVRYWKFSIYRFRLPYNRKPSNDKYIYVR